MLHVPLAPAPPPLDGILALVRERTGADFRGQRRPKLERRVVNGALRIYRTPADPGLRGGARA